MFINKKELESLKESIALQEGLINGLTVEIHGLKLCISGKHNYKMQVINESRQEGFFTKYEEVAKIICIRCKNIQKSKDK